MADDTVIGLVVRAEDLATKTINGVARAAKSTLGSVRTMGDKVKGAFKAIGGAMTTMNQALEIGRKAWGLLKMAVGDTITEALRFRKEGDPVLGWFRNLKRESELLKAAIGDTLIPVVQTLAESLGLVGNQTSNWIRENRKLIATDLLTWLINTARVLTKSVAFASLRISEIWNGWGMIVGTVQLAVNKYFAFLLNGIGIIIDGWSQITRLTGANEIADSLDAAKSAVRGLGAEFDKSGDQAVQSVYDSAAALAEQKKVIEETADVALKKIDDAHARGLKVIQESSAGARRTREEEAAHLKSVEDGVDAFLRASHDARMRRLALEESIRIANAKNEEERQKKAAEDEQARLEKHAELIASVGESFATMTAGVVQGFFDQRDAGAAAAKALASGVIDVIISLISGYAAQGAAAAFASMSGIPFIGPALGAAAAATVQAAIQAIGSGIKSSIGGMAGGGFVRGGTPGRDSVLIRAMQDEYVMSRGEVDGARTLLTRLLGAQAGAAAPGLINGTAPAGGQSGSPVVINNTTQIRTWKPGIVEEVKMAQDLDERAYRRLRQQGIVRT